MRQTVREYITATQRLLELEDLSNEEQQAVRKLMGPMTAAFPDEWDDAAVFFLPPTEWQ